MTAMSFAFPQFGALNALGGRRSWTARFESFDPRNDVVYYTIRLHDDGAVTGELIGAVMYPTSPSAGAELEAAIASQLRDIALSGETNTDYKGSPFAAR